MTDTAAWKAFQDALAAAWSLARTEKLRTLRGERSRLLDDRGLHPFSLEVGRIQALREVFPWLAELDWDVREMVALAAESAWVQFRLEVGVEMGWITEQQAMEWKEDEDAGGTTKRQDRRDVQSVRQGVPAETEGR